jgi:hypothetical protein
VNPWLFFGGLFLALILINVAAVKWGERKRQCFHHDPATGKSMVSSHLEDLGRRKVFECSGCRKVWIT